MSRHDFLYEMKFWEVDRAIRGYNRRQCSEWSRTRWLAYNVMSAMPYCDLKKAGIYRPTDLLHLPTDDDNQSTGGISDNEASEMVKVMQAMNRKARRKKTRK